MTAGQMILRRLKVVAVCPEHTRIGFAMRGGTLGSRKAPSARSCNMRWATARASLIEARPVRLAQTLVGDYDPRYGAPEERTGVRQARI
jgi:hypothetical protein